MVNNNCYDLAFQIGFPLMMQKNYELCQETLVNSVMANCKDVCLKLMDEL